MTTSTTTEKATDAAQSFREWAHARPLSETLLRAEAAVRAKPQAPAARWLLFELLCVLGQWERALKQLQTWAGLSKEFDSTAHVFRGLIRAERQRVDVFAGRTSIATVAAEGAPPALWMAQLGHALKLAAHPVSDVVSEVFEAVDLAREAALSQVPDTPGRADQRSFAWIADSDSRLGPVCEVILVGAYRWIAFDDLASVTKAQPASLIDIVWSQANFVLRDGEALKGYMPMRYPVGLGDRDALLMSRETVWSETGRTGVHARGQKMWMTDSGDISLLDLRSCTFNGAQADAED
ncbi:type VI secretion system accessory protein TagJ [soil metagenome]